jgi:hypothetical protein
MKRLFLFLILLLCFCKHSAFEGDCPVEPVKLSKKEIFFRVEGGIDSVTAEGFWLDPIIRIGDTAVHYYSYPHKYYLISEETSRQLLDYEGYISYILFIGNSIDVKHVEGSWFVIDRPDKNKIVFSVSENETGKARYFNIFLEAGNCGSSVKIIQSAE